MENLSHDPTRACAHVSMCSCGHDPTEKLHGHMPTCSHVQMVALACALALSACQLTDHTEGANTEVTADQINIPASGYADVDTASLPRMSFDGTSFDFGRVSQGMPVQHVYRFTNTGGGDLLITDVRGSCGCTVVKDWPKHPVRPGEGGAITVDFDSKGRSGRQEKVITIVANTRRASTPLFMHGEVVAPEPAN